nr:protein kinase [Nanoarchaeota archaeon]
MKPPEVAVNIKDEQENLVSSSDSNLENIIKSERYTLKGLLGRGCWGIVYHGQDSIMDEEVAIKILYPNEVAQQQMQERNISPIKAMKKEALKLAACSNVVPRKLEIDEEGKPFIVMPRYEKTLADVLNDKGDRKFFNNGLSIEEVNKYIKDISTGISETHNKLKRTHGDLKPDNIVLDEKGNALLTDFGSSTCASTGRSVSPRDNIGFVYIRAPENFKKGSHPEKESDIWALDAIKYRLYTGKYPLEDEFNNSKDPRLFLEQVGDKGINNIIRKKIRKNKKNIPRKARKLLKKGLDVNPKKRHSSIDDVIKDFDKSTRLGFIVRHPYLATGVALGLLGLFTAGSWAAYNTFSKDGTIKNLITAVEESKKYKVGAKWNGGKLEINNNLIDIGIRINQDGYRKSTKFPSGKVLYVEPGENLSITLSAKEIASSRDYLYPSPPSLKGKIYILGYDAKEFNVHAISHDETSLYDSMGQGYVGYNRASLDVPKDIPEGNHFLAVEIYAPKEPPEHYHSVNHQAYNFKQPGKAISRLMIPLITGDVEDKVNLDEIRLGWYKSFVSFRDKTKDKNDFSGFKVINRNLQYELFIPEENIKLNFLGEGNTNAFFKNIRLENGSGLGSKTLQIVIKDPNGKPISYSWTPIKWHVAFDTSDGGKMYEWSIDLPGPDFSERIIQYRKNLMLKEGMQ